MVTYDQWHKGSIQVQKKQTRDYLDKSDALKSLKLDGIQWSISELAQAVPETLTLIKY